MNNLIVIQHFSFLYSIKDTNLASAITVYSSVIADAQIHLVIATTTKLQYNMIKLTSLNYSLTCK